MSAETTSETCGDGWSRLEGGLRAAFGGPMHVPGLSAGSVVATLAEAVGGCSRVLLREMDGESPPRVNPYPPEELPIPSAPGSRYLVLGELARGGVGVVLHGRDTDLGRDVAMKVLRPDFADRPSMVRRFVEEAQITGQLQHPGILPVHELGLQDRRRPYFTMRLIRGQTLAALLGKRATAPDERPHFLQIFAKVCDTVAYAHARGVIHRDLKPANIMVGAFGEVQVVDWGLAKVRASTCQTPTLMEAPVVTVRSGSEAAQSVVGSVMGTPTYMPPEQARGQTDQLDERADVFALGAILCEILTGAPPYPAASREALQLAARGELRPALERIDASEADPDLCRLAIRCLAADPSERPADAGVVAQAITTFHESLEQRARAAAVAAAESAARAAGERRTRRLTLALAGVIVAAILTASAAWLRLAQRAADRQQHQAAIVQEAMEYAAERLGLAVAARVGVESPWNEALAAGNALRLRLADPEIAAEMRARGEELLQRLAQADRDRRIILAIEEAVSIAATHTDSESWLWMEKSLRNALLDYGIDLSSATPDEAAAAIRRSDLAPQLADGLELWIATCADLISKGSPVRPMDELQRWIEALYVADPDPLAAQVRRMVYGEPPTAEAVRELAAGLDYEKCRPRTLAWLASAAGRAKDDALVHEIFRRGTALWPDDFMFNFDHAFALVYEKQWSRAIRYYHRCLALRPASGGVWRCLGVALRETGELEESADALRESLKHQPNHVATLIDLGLTYQLAGRTDEARAALNQALDLRPDDREARKLLRDLSQ